MGHLAGLPVCFAGLGSGILEVVLESTVNLSTTTSHQGLVVHSWNSIKEQTFNLLFIDADNIIRF